ncbi:MAG: hypothetical protein IH859_03810 [Chloroflexi bacterium]|nr:hypothetical protein [Chloroflexota bacterium]
MEERPISESAWSRGWADFKEWLGSWQFWAVEVFGGGLVGILSGSPVIALYFIFGMAAMLWIGTTVRAPVKQRNEARNFIAQFVGARANLSPIAEIISSGRALRYRSVKSEENLKQWLNEYDQWVADASFAIGTIFGVAEEELFNTVENLMAADISGSFNERHNLKRLIIDKRLQSLRNLVQRQT